MSEMRMSRQQMYPHGTFSLALHRRSPQTLDRIRPLVRVFSEVKQFKIAEVGIDQLDM